MTSIAQIVQKLPFKKDYPQSRVISYNTRYTTNKKGSHPNTFSFLTIIFSQSAHYFPQRNNKKNIQEIKDWRITCEKPFKKMAPL